MSDLSSVPSCIDMTTLRTDRVRPSAFVIKDKYLFEETLGHGSFGEVARYRDIQHQTLCAIKIIPLSQLHLAEAAQRELNIFRKLQHPYVVKLHEIFHEEERVLLVMDL